jgi:Ser/Thr protein kinase RdoA (MazF antagonist)
MSQNGGTRPPQAVLDQLGLHPDAVVTLRDQPGENRSWLLATAGRRAVLRGYHGNNTEPDLIWQHEVLAYLAGLGWTVPAPLSPLVGHDGRFWYLTRYVPGAAIRDEDAAQQRRRGRWLARLHVALRDLYASAGQRPGWQPQH